MTKEGGVVGLIYGQSWCFALVWISKYLSALIRLLLNSHYSSMRI